MTINRSNSILFRDVTPYSDDGAKFHRVSLLHKAGISFETYHVTSKNGEEYYQHVVFVASLEERADCRNGLLWRIDSDKPELGDLVARVFNTIHHGVTSFEGDILECDKNNLRIAQRCVFEHPSALGLVKDEYNHDVTFITSDNETVVTSVSSTHLRKTTRQKITWSVTMNDGTFSTTSAFSAQRDVVGEVVILSLGEWSKIYYNQLEGLFHKTQKA